MTYDQLEQLFQPQGTGQVYFSPGAAAGTYPVGAKPITEAPPEIQYRYQQQLRSRPIGDISPIVMTDYTHSRMTLGPTTYTHEQQIAGQQAEQESLYASRAAAVAASRGRVATTSPATKAVSPVSAALGTPQEQLAAFDARVPKQLPMTQAQRDEQLALHETIGKQEQDRMESAAKFFDEALLKGTIRQDPNSGLKMLQKKKVINPVDGSETMVDDYTELPPATKAMLLELVKRGVRSPDTYGMKGLSANKLPDAAAAGDPRLDYNANLQPDRGILGPIMNAATPSRSFTEASNMFDSGVPAAIGNIIPRASNIVQGAFNSLGRTLVGDSYTGVPDVPMWMNPPPPPSGSYFSPAEIAAIMARQPF